MFWMYMYVEIVHEWKSSSGPECVCGCVISDWAPEGTQHLWVVHWIPQSFFRSTTSHTSISPSGHPETIRTAERQESVFVQILTPTVSSVDLISSQYMSSIVLCDTKSNYISLNYVCVRFLFDLSLTPEFETSQTHSYLCVLVKLLKV